MQDDMSDAEWEGFLLKKESSKSGLTREERRKLRYHDWQPRQVFDMFCEPCPEGVVPNETLHQLYRMFILTHTDPCTTLLHGRVEYANDIKAFTRSLDGDLRAGGLNTRLVKRSYWSYLEWIGQEKQFLADRDLFLRYKVDFWTGYKGKYLLRGETGYLVCVKEYLSKVEVPHLDFDME